MQKDKVLVNDLNYDRIEFPVSVNWEKKISIVFYKNKLTFPIHISDQKIEHSVEILTDIRFTKQTAKNKKHFCKTCFQCFCSTNIFTEHKEVCLNNNGTQSVRFKKWKIEFQRAFKKIPVPFKIYWFTVYFNQCRKSWRFLLKKISRSHSL